MPVFLHIHDISLEEAVRRLIEVLAQRWFSVRTGGSILSSSCSFQQL